MNIILFDNYDVWANMLPITMTRPVSQLRMGITTIAQKWQDALPGTYSTKVACPYLAELFPAMGEDDADTLYIASHILPTAELLHAVKGLGHGEALVDIDGNIIAHRGLSIDNKTIFSRQYPTVTQLYHIFGHNSQAICGDFLLITHGRQSLPLSDTNTVIGDPSLVFLESGARVEGAFLNTTNGPIYIGADAEIMEGSMLRGPIAICEHATVNMGAKIYGGTTIGPWCKVGGEINNAVFQGFSNKAHDGFLGNAIVGEWCNIGAGAVASNLKNDYTPVRLWSYPAHRFVRTELQFCGLIMGDHSKAGINTMFNTATVLGVGVNVHGAGFPRNFVPSFTEWSPGGAMPVQASKFFDIAGRAMARRHCDLSDAQRRMLLYLMEHTDPTQ